MDIYEPDENGIGEIMLAESEHHAYYCGNEEATNECIYYGWSHTGDLDIRIRTDTLYHRP